MPDLRISATDTMPDMTGSVSALAQARRVHEEDAQRIVDALLASLPGGTFDQVVRFMLERKASHLVVPYGTESTYEAGQKDALRTLASAVRKVLNDESVRSLASALTVAP